MAHRVITPRSKSSNVPGCSACRTMCASFTLLWCQQLGGTCGTHAEESSTQLVLSWVHEPHLSRGQELNFSHLTQHLQHFGFSLTSTAWATITSRPSPHLLSENCSCGSPKATPERHQSDTRATRRATEIKSAGLSSLSMPTPAPTPTCQQTIHDSASTEGAVPLTPTRYGGAAKSQPQCPGG